MNIDIDFRGKHSLAEFLSFSFKPTSLLSFSVPNFEVSEFMITNREMLEFVRDGGYENDQLWDEEGLKWRDFRKIR